MAPSGTEISEGRDGFGKSADVYEELMKYEQEGKFEVISYEKVAPERIRDLYEYMAQKLVNNGIVKQPDCEEAVFYQTYFELVWRMALERAKSVGE